MRNNQPYSNIPKKTPGVYALICTATGDRYAGSSNNVRRRANEHFSDMRRGVHDNDRIQDLYETHGSTAFKIEILAVIEDRDDRLDLEQVYINDEGYTLNQCPSSRGEYIGETTRAKMSAAGTGRTLSPEACAKVSASKTGSKNYRYQGLYETPFGTFESRDLAAQAVPDKNLSDVSIRTWCCSPDKQISAIAYGKSPFLNSSYPRHIIGKTYRDLGFSFIPKDKE